MIRSLIWRTGFGVKENVKEKCKYLWTNKEKGIPEIGTLHSIQM